MKKNIVYYHANCADGFCAAWVAHRFFGAEADYLPLAYSQEIVTHLDSHVYLLDYSIKTVADLTAVALKCKQVTIIDHHESTQPVAQWWADHAECSNVTGWAQISLHFDTTKSGARLTWEYFYPDEPAPWLVRYTEDRDLWQWQLPESQEINTALASYPFDFDVWDAFHNNTTMRTKLAYEGSILLRAKEQAVQRLCQKARNLVIAGYTVPVVNSPIHRSEIGHELCQGQPFAVIWFQRTDGKFQFSFRSESSGINVREIAERFGGGGHPHAAGVELDYLPTEILLSCR